MRTKFNVFLTLILALVVQLSFAQDKVITGVVTEAGTGEALPGVNVVVKGTDTGAATDFDGKYTIKAEKGQTLVFSFVGYNTVERKVGDSNVINVELKAGDQLETVVIVGAQGIKEKPKEISYAQQVVKSKDLTLGKDTNIKTAISGKVAGVQVIAQAGSKLGQTGKVYLRGALSATGRNEAIYIVDGVETSPENVDMENVESINVLKGPSAVALYGLRGADGVVVITTKSAKKGDVRVEVFNNTTFESVAYLPNYQNEYGQGYAGEDEWNTFDYNAGAWGYFPYPTEWAPIDGQRYITSSYADESWGPKFDGEDYMPWYTWWPGEDGSNPYFAQPQKYVAQPDNVKDFYDTGVNSKTGFAVSGGSDKAKGRLSFSTNDVKGLIPTTGLTQNVASAKFSVDLTDKLTIGVNGTISKKEVSGGTNFDDSYANPISGSFNQWFGRNLETDKMKELKDLKTMDGYTTTWNWWDPDIYAYGYNTGNPKYVKPVFWFNPYWQLEQEDYNTTYNRFVGIIDMDYKFTDNFKIKASASKTGTDYKYDRKTNYLMQYNSTVADGGYIDYLNSMTQASSYYELMEYKLMGEYNLSLSENTKVDIYLGSNYRTSNYDYTVSAMSKYGNPLSAGFVIPDVYSFANSKEKVVPETVKKEYKTLNVFSRFRLNYKDYLFLTGDISNVWDSRYDIVGLENDNAFMFGSAGLSFVFTEAFSDSMPEFLNFGKVRFNVAQVGTEVSANALNPGYELPGDSYNSLPLMYTPETIVDPSVQPATSTALEAGIDLKMLQNRVLFSLTYFNEHRTDEIISTAVPYETGAESLMTNAGDVQRTGFEIELGADIIKSEDFKWNMTVNFSNPYVEVLELAEGTDSQLLSRSSFGVVSVVNIAGEEYGQLQGTAIKRDDNGNPVLIETVDPVTGEASYTYDLEAGHNFGSILPDFNGGIVNRFSYKGFDLAATINYQSGGKFFSLTEWWGTYTGLLEETAGLNDKGNPQRDPVADGGGVHVTGVLNDGTSVDAYTDAHAWYQQQYPTLAEGFIHDASFIKLAEVSLSYTFPKSVLGKYIKGATIGVVARNLGMLSVSSENKHNWDPSEFGYMFGDDAQLPGTTSYGFNVKLTF